MGRLKGMKQQQNKHTPPLLSSPTSSARHLPRNDVTTPARNAQKARAKQQKHQHHEEWHASHLEVLAVRAMTAYMQVRQISDAHPTVAETFRYPLSKRLCDTWHLDQVISGYTGVTATHLEVHIEVDNGGWEWEIGMSWLMPVAITEEMSKEERNDLSGTKVRLPWLTVRCEGSRAICVDEPEQLDEDLMQFIATALMTAGVTLTQFPITRLPRPEIVQIHRTA